MAGPATLLLHRAQRGDVDARDELYRMLYDELRGLAASQLSDERSGHTLTPTALVHEAYIALVGQEASWNDRTHMLAVAASAMRHLLIDYARRRHAAKRGGHAVHVPLDDVSALLSTAGVNIALTTNPVEGLLNFDHALNALSLHDTRFGDVVECRVFGGLTVNETAAALGLSSATVDRIWAKARAYLRIALNSGDATA